MCGGTIGFPSLLLPRFARGNTVNNKTEEDEIVQLPARRIRIWMRYSTWSAMVRGKTGT